MSSDCSIDTIALTWTTITTKITTDDVNPITGWMRCAGLKEVRSTFEVARLDGDMTLSPGVQFANHPDAPGTVVAELSAFKAAADVYYGTEWKDVSSEADANQLFRLVWVAKNAASSNLTSARVAGTTTLRWS